MRHSFLALNAFVLLLCTAAQSFGARAEVWEAPEQFGSSLSIDIDGINDGANDGFFSVAVELGSVTPSLGKDFGGCSGSDPSSWDCEYSAALIPLNLIPTPEPRTYGSTAVTLLGLLLCARRRTLARLTYTSRR
jgi:hypothetical protein